MTVAFAEEELCFPERFPEITRLMLRELGWNNLWLDSLIEPAEVWLPPDRQQLYELGDAWRLAVLGLEPGFEGRTP